MRLSLFRLLASTALLPLCILLLLSPQLLTESTAVTSFVANLVFNHNLHVVVPGKIYRSAAIPPAELPALLQQYGIRTVIDLRRRDGDAVEREIVETHGAQYLTVPLNAGRPAGRQRLLRLLESFDQAQTPILLHCTSGTHRSGLASAIWLLEKEGASFATAARQLSSAYGYFALERRIKSYFSGYPTLDEDLWSYGAAREVEGVDFRRWVEQMPDAAVSDERAAAIRTSAPQEFIAGSTTEESYETNPGSS